MAYSMDLAGRVALVTGASGGLGAQFARTLARAGAGVVLASRRMDKLKALRAEIEGEGGDAHVVEMDVTDTDSIRAAVAHAETEMGSLDILVNNSGVSTTQRLVDVTEDDFSYVFDTNVRGAFFVAQEVGKRMLARAKGEAPGLGPEPKAQTPASREPDRLCQTEKRVPAMAEAGVKNFMASAVARRVTSRVSLQLSGHTHGGMVRGLDRIVARANNGYVSGFYRVGEMQLYVNNGTGLWPGFALRIGVPAELTEFTLRAARG